MLNDDNIRKIVLELIAHIVEGSTSDLKTLTAECLEFMREIIPEFKIYYREVELEDIIKDFSLEIEH